MQMVQKVKVRIMFYLTELDTRGEQSGTLGRLLGVTCKMN